MPKPMLLVDIDGVLNAFTGVGLPKGPFEQEVKVTTSQKWGGGASYWIRIPEGTSERLAKLAEEFEMVWASMWQGDCHECIGNPLCKIEKEWPHIVFEGTVNNLPRVVPEDIPGAKTYKLPYVAAYVGRRPMAWIDDDLNQDAAHWAQMRRNNGDPTLLVKPNTAIGLTDKHVEILLEWAESLKQKAA